MTDPDPATAALRAAADRIDDTLRGLGPRPAAPQCWSGDWRAWWARSDAACDAVAAELGADLRATGGGWRFRLLGLVTHSTSCRAEALRGWSRRAHERARLAGRAERAAS